MASTGQPQSSLKRRDLSGTREGDQMIITPLGAGNEVGRFCVYMSYKGKTILVYCNKISLSLSLSIHGFLGFIVDLDLFTD